MKRSFDSSGAIVPAYGFSAVELLVVLAVVAICVVAAVRFAHAGFMVQSARGAAQCWQAAAAWAQIDVMWRGGSRTIVAGPTDLCLVASGGDTRSDLGEFPTVRSISANPASWQSSDGVRVRFSGEFAAPSGGGSVYFHSHNAGYRVVVRPVSGFTVRNYEADK
ncbi:MAG: prepilin-type N-terminal cleavage/methylation domain-containing protein [Thermoleophilia bacterium]|nr:prepilin-type N-terminal cleavage/methylation domain-containing protein [Thermoleophilia bacterium]